MREVRVKICGLKTPDDVAAVAQAGAAYAGFNFFPKSPRYVPPEAAHALALSAPEGLCKVALVVDADDGTLDAIVGGVPLDMLQLHGHETPARVAEVKARYGLPVMKVIGVAEEADLAPLLDYQLVADQILVDAKAPKGAVLPGGNGLTFDWRLLVGRKWLKPWMLAGGLTPENVGQAIQRTGARQVDVASGVESAPGVKDAAKIAAFVEAAKGVKGGVPILR
ncbi:MAG: phosphoribosylanthranilate isomerase [Tabrizicola sp.]|nr:phosphoribosylanthranilate isomerase [Tabrizicola sp.]